MCTRTRKGKSIGLVRPPGPVRPSQTWKERLSLIDLRCWTRYHALLAFRRSRVYSSGGRRQDFTIHSAGLTGCQWIPFILGSQANSTPDQEYYQYFWPRYRGSRGIERFLYHCTATPRAKDNFETGTSGSGEGRTRIIVRIAICVWAHLLGLGGVVIGVAFLWAVILAGAAIYSDFIFIAWGHTRIERRTLSFDTVDFEITRAPAGDVSGGQFGLERERNVG